MWVGVQSKAFSRWCNVVLEKKKLKVNNLSTDLKDGLLLVQMLEQLTEKEIKHNPKPKLAIHQLENVQKALTFLKEDGVSLVNVGAEDITGGNLKLTLGLIWTMILRYQINTNDGSANKELLDWVNSVIPENPVKNFTKDWQDGRALSHLVEALNPGCIKPEEITGDALKNLKNAMDKAHNQMQIPDIVDPEDMAESPDPLSNMTYISYFREYQKLAKERELFERTVVASECVAWGPGLQPSLPAGTPTGFVVGARNGAGRPVPMGGTIFTIKITGPNSDVTTSVTDTGDGSYNVKYTPEQEGNHFIQVTYNGQQIKGSPFQVSSKLMTPRAKPKTAPVPRWYYEETHHEGFKSVSKWVKYDDASSDEIEKAFKVNPYAVVDLFNGQSNFDFSKLEEKSNVKKHTKRKICRGTWFFQDDDGSFAPYDAYTAHLLETEFQSGSFVKVNVSEKPPRWVASFADGSFKQFRQTKGGNPNGRPVQRGFNSQVVEVPNSQ